ncbi:MAG: hypothetical protein HY591_07155, partial [Candidatus Omnitrophica bacterium]|nr:hypothetical protein [Candidatus Omnitrophota bacterium]
MVSKKKILSEIKSDLARNFYTEMCRLEKWSVPTLRKEIKNM